jgi:hypothetical protein
MGQRSRASEHAKQQAYRFLRARARRVKCGRPLSLDQLTLQTILQLGYAAYEHRHPVPAYVRRAVWALLVCRTTLLGGHVQACPDAHVERIWSWVTKSCQSRMLHVVCRSSPAPIKGGILWAEPSVLALPAGC